MGRTTDATNKHGRVCVDDVAVLATAPSYSRQRMIRSTQRSLTNTVYRLHHLGLVSSAEKYGCALLRTEETVQVPAYTLVRDTPIKIAPVTFCRNTLRSRPIIEACGGALSTRQYRRNFDSIVTGMTCSACGEDEETTEHLLLRCQRHLPAPIGSSRIKQTLGFTRERERETTLFGPEKGEEPASRIQGPRWRLLILVPGLPGVLCLAQVRTEDP
ncbi:hypothetical protein HPB47_014771 [Ixodes persulcatus]|uniref:Uncharacterized protein n=1 Tax=Ixodes persulcatus TaxID=34615 RepID=A0AC60QV54_IXOPE|nr:hypothetical protein HPB47_014771 [Ixodes persulcatus]